MSAENLPSKWVNIRLKELLLIPSRNGIYKPKEFHGKGVKIVNMGEMFSYNRIGNQHMKRLELNENEKKNHLLENGDLLFARRSLTAEGAGKCSIIQNLSEPTTFESSIIRLRPNPKLVNPVFLYNFFKSPQGVYQIGTILRQVAVSGITSTDLVELEIALPPLVTQRRIAAILTALDDKIELNRRMNETLEGIAQAVWGEWFGKYASGEVELPEGWRWGKIGDICEVNKNKISKNIPLEWIDYVEISEVNRGKIGNIARYKRGMEPSRAKRKILHGDVILSTVRPDRGAYFLSLYPEKTMIVSTGFAVFTAKSVPYCFLYVLLTQDEMLDYYGHMADGGAYPAINPSVILEKEMAIPDDKRLAKYQKIAEPIFEKIHFNNQQSHTLTDMRDALLPRLMRGEMEV